jgi:hypothetical protein
MIQMEFDKIEVYTIVDSISNNTVCSYEALMGISLSSLSEINVAIKAAPGEYYARRLALLRADDTAGHKNSTISSALPPDVTPHPLSVSPRETPKRDVDCCDVSGRPSEVIPTSETKAAALQKCPWIIIEYEKMKELQPVSRLDERIIEYQKMETSRSVMRFLEFERRFRSIVQGLILH